MRAFTRRNAIAACAGLALGLVCLSGFHIWTQRLIDRQGQEDVDNSARRLAAVIDTRLGQVVEALEMMSALGKGSCRDSYVEAMGRAVFDTLPVKELSLVTPAGEKLCSYPDQDFGQRMTLSSEPLAMREHYLLDVIDVVGHRHMVRLRREVGGGPEQIAAMVPASFFLPQVLAGGGLFNAYAEIRTPEGAVIGGVGTRSADTDQFVSWQVSERFGIVINVATPRASLDSNAELRQIGIVVSIIILFAISALIALTWREPADNPVNDMKRALRAGEFVPYYQPIVDIHTGQLRGAEVLVRWRKADGTMVLPGSFIPLAESSGLIRAMTRDLMRRVCVEAGPTLARRPAMKVSFNFAGKLFADESIVKEVRNIFSGSPIKLSQVVLEVTERDPIENFTETRRNIAALQGLGVRIAIDDVGTGHSGLSYMLKLGVDIIKIDKMFVDSIGSDRNSATIVETLVDLAHNMRMDVVAEGVEDFEQVIHLRDLGVRSAQGYVFAPPLPGRSFLSLVEAIDPLPAEEAGAEGRRSAA